MHIYQGSNFNMMIPGPCSCVKTLIIANVVCWFFLVVIFQQYILGNLLVYEWLGFVPVRVSDHFFIWQFFTYMFIHSSGVFHLLFNMLMLWMFGSELEQLWRSRFFLTFYLVCGVGSALVYFVSVKLYLLLGGELETIAHTPMVGASGAIFGLLLAYGWIFGERWVLFMFIFPMKARTFTLLIACVTLLTIVSSGLGGPVANLAHLGGLLSGFLFLYIRRAYTLSPFLPKTLSNKLNYFWFYKKIKRGIRGIKKVK